jgi:glycosyltransferase involved in cell wall biosynthesis
MNSILLTVIVPTYKRPQELNRCLTSILNNLRELSSQDQGAVEILISDNGGSGDYAPMLNLISMHCSLTWIRHKQNVGIQKNILNASKKSSGSYFVWITDDDGLVEGGLSYLLSSIKKNQDCGFFWCALPTYDSRTGNLFTVPSVVSQQTEKFLASCENAAKHARWAWALTRQTYRKDLVDFEWAEKFDNAYFCIGMAIKQMLQAPSIYLNQPYVFHTYFNEEHWEEWGQDILDRKLRIFVDYLKSFDIINFTLDQHVISNEIKMRRQEEYSSFFTSNVFQLILQRDGLDGIKNKLKKLLQSREVIFLEILNYLNLTPK